MNSVLTRLDEVHDIIVSIKKRLKPHNTKEVRARLAEALNGYQAEFNAIVATVNGELRDDIKSIFSENPEYLAIPSPVKGKKITEFEKFRIVGMTLAGFQVALDDNITLLPMFGELGANNLHRLKKYYDEREKEKSE